jgi:hypothetical protein
MTQTGELEFDGSDAGRVLNGINQMTLQSQRTNVAAYMPTDCPTREKHGCDPRPRRGRPPHPPPFLVFQYTDLSALKSCTAAETLFFLFRTVAPCVHLRWMGDALDASEQSMFNFDTAAVHAAFMQTIVDNQGPNGDVPTVGPGLGTFPFPTR